MKSKTRVLAAAATMAIIVALSPQQQAQFLEELPRHAYWGASFEGPPDNPRGAKITAVTKDGFIEKIGLQPGDIILKVNNLPADTPAAFEELFFSASKVKGATEVTMEVDRGGNLLRKKGTIPPRPKEVFPGVVTEYRSIQSPRGYRVQVIITRPEKTKGKIPGIFVVRWMSCDPIEKPVSRKHGVARMLDDLITKSGFAVIRVEKPGLGDSEGPSCYNADFHHELAAHQAAYEAFRKLDFIDSTRLTIFAQSNGAAYAPLVAGNAPPAAFVVSGGWTKTWFEHMMEFKRRALERDNIDAAGIAGKMTRIAEFYSDCLIAKRSPSEIISAKPYLRDAWDGYDDHQWGLPITYMQQLQDLNVAAAWHSVSVPTYVFFGEYDFAMVEEDHHQIAAWVNTNKPDAAQVHVIPNMDHSLFWFNSAHDAATDFYGKGTYRNELADSILVWLKNALQVTEQLR